MNKMTLVIIGGVLFFGYLTYSFISKPTEKQKEPYVSKYNIKRTLTDNDKLITIWNADFRDVQQVVSDFTRNYDNPQQASLKPFSKIYKLDESQVVITFPYDIDFEIFCYYVNYLKYPIDIDYDPTILAWSSTSSKYQWLDESFDRNKVIVFIDPNDNEYDNVMITTKKGKAYKVGFAVGYGLQEESDVIQSYEQPPLNFSELNRYESVEIR